MKRLIICVVILIFIGQISAMAQYNPDYNRDERKSQLYTKKVVKYNKLKRTGIGLGLAGGVLTVGGIALVSNADWETTTNYNGQQNTTTEDPGGVAGVFMILVGVPLAVTGIVLGSIGSSKARQYREKLEDISFNVHYTNYNKGVSLCYRF